MLLIAAAAVWDDVTVCIRCVFLSPRARVSVSYIITEVQMVARTAVIPHNTGTVSLSVYVVCVRGDANVRDPGNRLKMAYAKMAFVSRP